jgi:hypothetical protein
MVLTHLDCRLNSAQIDSLVSAQSTGPIERLLFTMRIKIELAISERRFRPGRAGRASGLRCLCTCNILLFNCL